MSKIVALSCLFFFFKSLILAQQPTLLMPLGHSDNVNKGSFSPDGKWVITASDDGTAKVWDVSNGQLQFELKGHLGGVECASYSNNGKKILTASNGGVKIWDASNGKLLYDLDDHTGNISSAEFSPDNRLIVSASDDKTANVWDVENGKLLFTLKGHNDRVNNASFSFDSKLIATSSRDGTSKVWDAANGNLISTTAEYVVAKPENSYHLANIRIVSTSMDEGFIATVSNDNVAKVWNTRTKQNVSTLNGHNNLINSVGFSSDGKLLVTSSSDNTAKVWAAENGKNIYTLSGHGGKIYNACFSLDDKLIATISDDNTVKIWDNINGHLITDFNKHQTKINNAFFSADGNKVISFSNDGEILFWVAQTGFVNNRYLEKARKIINAVCSPDGKTAVTVYNDNSIAVWDILNGNLLSRTKESIDTVSHIKFAVKGEKIIIVFGNNTAKVLDIATSNLSHSWTSVFVQSPEKLFLRSGHIDEINFVSFSPDGRRIATASDDGTAKVWDVYTGHLLVDLNDKSIGSFSDEDSLTPDWKLINNMTGLGSKEKIRTATFSPDGLFVVTASEDGIAKVWNSFSGEAVILLVGHQAALTSARFSPNGKLVLTSSEDGTAAMWDPFLQTLVNVFTGHKDYVNVVAYSYDAKMIVTASDDRTAKIWDVSSGKLLRDLKGHTSVPSGISFCSRSKCFITYFEDGTAKVWNNVNGQLIANLKGHSQKITSACFSPDGNRVVTTSEDSTIKIWEAATGSLIFDLKENETGVEAASFSLDGKWLLTVSTNGRQVRVWNHLNGKTVTTLKINKDDYDDIVQSASFSIDGKRILTSFGNTAKVWDTESGTLLFEKRGEPGYNVLSIHVGYHSAAISPNGQLLVNDFNDKVPDVWDVSSGKLLFKLEGHTDQVKESFFSPDGKRILTYSYDNTVKIWNAENGKLIFNFSGFESGLKKVCFSQDGKLIISYTWAGDVKIWDSFTGINKTAFSVDSGESVSGISVDENFLSAFNNNEVIFYDLSSKRKLYTLLAVDNSEHLIYDSDNHYDGTEAARNLLYFTCGTEVIGLDQVKDQLWVPGLVGRIMKGETINEPKLSDLDLCGLLPEVETIEENDLQYRFKITARRGGLGQTVLYINNIEAKRFETPELIHKEGWYELQIDKRDFDSLLISGEENTFTVKAYTKTNSLFSRGIVVTSPGDKTIKVRPNLYAVMIGVSNYKGKELDLKYAAKDAAELSSAVSVAARKMLNTGDGIEHVFTYNINTSSEGGYFPDKRSIKKVLDEIGSKSKANDVLILFFAGHGVMDSSVKKQFYLLTADASKNSDYAVAGISTAELTEWLKPQNMKAQKRILILDACNSGKAIDELVKINLRNDDHSAQIKAIDKLGEKSGFFILSASAANQSAYEMSNYNQGILTYALLKAIKQQPEILEEGRYLNIGKWFIAADHNVLDAVKETGAIQDPQISSNGNINIGVVDEDVRAAIQLADANLQFTASNFQSSDDITDNLNFGEKIDSCLFTISQRGNSNVVFNSMYKSPEAINITGRYSLNADMLKVTVFIRKNKNTLTKLEFSDTKKALDKLAFKIADDVTNWMMKNKKPH